MHIITKAMKLFSLPLITLLFVNVLLYAQAPTTWVLGTQYNSGSIVGYGDNFYRAIQDVPGSVGGTPDTLTDYWVDIFSTKPTVDPEDPPTTEPDTSDTDLGNLTPPEDPDTNTVQIFSLSTRAGIYGDDMSASLNMGGDVSTPKKVMFRVKGPSMNFNGAKLANPWMDVYKRSNAQGSAWTEFFQSYDFGDHASKDNYADRSTGNDVEPMVVESITPSIVSCVVSSESTGGTGNAIVEIYSLEDDNSSSYFKSLSTRGYVSDSDMSGSVRLVGTGTKHIMFRVKGPSMNFSGSKLADPNLAIYHKENGWAEMVKTSTFQQYDSQDSSYTNVTSNYTERHTGNNLEPLVVYELSAGTYSCIVSSDVTGGMGSAILEIYDVSE